MKNVYQVHIVDPHDDDRIIEYSEIYANYDDADRLRSKWATNYQTYTNITVTIRSFVLIEKVTVNSKYI